MRIEADRISRATSKSLHEFAEKVEDFESYSYRMKKTRDGKCVFLRDNVCVIYQLRPLICRFYPFGLKDVGNNRHVFSYTDECPCIGKGSLVKKEYFEELFKVSVKLMQENVTQDNGDNDRNGV
jgi:Fe-S-cluster containining protein